MKRVMIFIDGSNMYHNLMSSFGKASLDFRAFSLKLTGDNRELVRTYYYNCPVDQYSNPASYREQAKFFAILRKTDDLELRLGRLQRRLDGRTIEKGIDVKLAVDILTKAYKNQYDVAILISGDADFSQVVQEVKDMAKHVELAVFPNQRCFHLRTVADRILELNEEFMKDCWI